MGGLPPETLCSEGVDPKLAVVVSHAAEANVGKELPILSNARVLSTLTRARCWTGRTTSFLSAVSLYCSLLTKELVP